MSWTFYGGDDLRFTRQDDGSVLIEKSFKNERAEGVTKVGVLDAETWQSLVAAMLR